MDIVKLLKVILSTNKILVNKISVFHHRVGGPRFLTLHPFFGESYNSLDEFTDKLAERIEGLEGEVELSLDKDVKLAVIKELASLPNENGALELMESDLDTFDVYLRKGISMSEDDIVTQNLLADLDTLVQTLCWKIRKTMKS